MIEMTQDAKFEPWWSEAEHATSRSRRLPTILTFTRGWGRNIFCFLQTAGTGNRTPDSGVKGSGGDHYPRAPAPPMKYPYAFLIPLRRSIQRTQNLDAMLFQCDGSTLKQHWVSFSCLLGYFALKTRAHTTFSTV